MGYLCVYKKGIYTYSGFSFYFCQFKKNRNLNLFKPGIKWELKSAAKPFTNKIDCRTKKRISKNSIYNKLGINMFFKIKMINSQTLLLH